MATDSRTTVAVLFGGRSSEHSVSCVSAKGVLGSLDPEKYEVLAIGITREGTWRRVEDWADFDFDPEAMPEVVENGTEVLPPLSVSGRPLLERLADGTVAELGTVDVFFPILHGMYGEDGTIQGLIELSGTPFVGPGVFASAASMDKHFMKVLLRDHGIPTAPWVRVTEQEFAREPEAVSARIAELGYPVFVKPARAGSSVGISKVNDPADLAEGLATAFVHDEKVIVEPGVVGREIECSVLGSVHDETPRTSLPGEIKVRGDHEFYDFEAKYLDLDAAEVICPAELSAEVTSKVRELAARTFQAFDCTGQTRVDTFVTAEGEVLVNELNTLPGFTPTSGYPRMWAATGMSYGELVNELVTIALRDGEFRARG